MCFRKRINTNELTFRNLEKLFLIFLVSEQLLDQLEGLLTKTLHTKDCLNNNNNKYYHYYYYYYY